MIAASLEKAERENMMSEKWKEVQCDQVAKCMVSGRAMLQVQTEQERF